MLGVATTLIGLGIVALPGHEAQAVAIFSQFGADSDGEAAGDKSGRSFAMSADGTRIAIGAEENDGAGSNAGHVRVYSSQSLPGASSISSVTATNGSLSIAFTAGSNGGSSITNYKYSIDGINYIAMNPATTTSPLTISGLTNGTTYSVKIKAVNGLGDAPASNAFTGTPVAPTTTTTRVTPRSSATSAYVHPNACTNITQTRWSSVRTANICNMSCSAGSSCTMSGNRLGKVVHFIHRT
jgi:hypothetical protein